MLVCCSLVGLKESWRVEVFEIEQKRAKDHKVLSGRARCTNLKRRKEKRNEEEKRPQNYSD